LRRCAKLTATLASIALAGCVCARALDPSLDVSQYAHTAWKIRDGFARGAIYLIAQTPDGYLWLGTDFGLLRFDGIRAVPWLPPAGEHLPANYIRSLLAARDGTLWIGTLKGFASWKDGKLTQYPDLAGQSVDALLEDRQGVIWVGTDGEFLATPGKLCAIQSDRVRCYGEDGALGRGVESLFEDSKGDLWAGTDKGVWRWKSGSPQRYLPDSIHTSQTLTEGDSGGLLIAANGAIKQFIDGKAEPYRPPGIGRQFIPDRVFRDRNGGLWIGARGQGVFHVHEGKTDVFAEPNGLSGSDIQRFYEDREGNVWVATLGGLDRFREYSIPAISRNQGASSSATWSILATADGSVLTGAEDGIRHLMSGGIGAHRGQSALNPGDGKNGNELNAGGSTTGIANGGLAGAPQSFGLDDAGRLWTSTREGVFYLEHGKFVRVPGLPGGSTYSIAGDKHGSVWILNSTDGIFHWSPNAAIQQTPWSQFAQKTALTLLPDREPGGLWIGFYDGGIVYMKDGKAARSYGPAQGLGDGAITQLRFGSRGAVWAATEGGLSRISDGHIETLSSKNGLPCDQVHWSSEDNDQAMWVYMSCGLARIDRSEWYAWVDDPRHVVKTTVFDTSDGVTSHAFPSGYSPHVTTSPDGRIWFIASGVSVIDPHHLAFNKLPPPVHVEQVTADRKTYNADADAGGRMRLPPLIRDLEIDYTALSLVVPEKNLFRYKLEGFDRDWQDVGNRRQAFYTNLPPGNYHFHVIACNNSGVWNEVGDSFEFSIAPAYYQTLWFKMLCATAFLAMLWALYQRRLHIIRRQYAAGLEATVGERLRVARELHDTLLQSFQGAVFQFQAARRLLLRNADNTIQVMDEAIRAAEQGITEGRAAIQDLRPEPAAQRDLPELLIDAGREVAESYKSNGHAPSYRVVVEGKQQDLSPMLQDEIYRISREVIRNAFAHAVASHIEVEIRYDHGQLRVRIRDDGKGIDAKTLQAGGQSGHWGITGMRERAQRIGAQLAFWSEAGAGTEVQLSVPGTIAYKKHRRGRRFRLFRGAGRDE
jgi:signal transduction histidine kinase/ligand-binding sensor domain-containing protein